MPSCCVPFCTSRKGKTANVSFHEFPSENSLRSSWLQKISRKDFVINDKSNSSVVCSLHFIKDVGKNRRLKTGAIPSIFPGYPQHKLSKPVPKRRFLKRVAAADNCPAISEKENLDKTEDSKLLEDAHLLLHFTNVSSNSQAAAELSAVELDGLGGECSSPISPVCNASVQIHLFKIFHLKTLFAN